MIPLRKEFYRVGIQPVLAFVHDADKTVGNPTGARYAWRADRDNGFVQDDALIADLTSEKRIPETDFNVFCTEHGIDPDVILAPAALTGPYLHADGQTRRGVISRLIGRASAKTGNVVPMARPG